MNDDSVSDDSECQPKKTPEKAPLTQHNTFSVSVRYTVFGMRCDAMGNLAESNFLSRLERASLVRPCHRVW